MHASSTHGRNAQEEEEGKKGERARDWIAKEAAWERGVGSRNGSDGRTMRRGGEWHGVGRRNRSDERGREGGEGREGEREGEKMLASFRCDESHLIG